MNRRDMLKAAGAQYVVIGHSERRQYFGETDETVNARLKAALEAGMKVILCLGEVKEERLAGITDEVVAIQTKLDLAGISAEDMKNVIIAYEPVWAIGTGKVASADDAQEVCAAIRELVKELAGEEVAYVEVLRNNRLNVAQTECLACLSVAVNENAIRIEIAYVYLSLIKQCLIFQHQVCGVDVSFAAFCNVFLCAQQYRGLAIIPSHDRNSHVEVIISVNAWLVTSYKKRFCIGLARYNIVDSLAHAVIVFLLEIHRETNLAIFLAFLAVFVESDKAFCLQIKCPKTDFS